LNGAAFANRVPKEEIMGRALLLWILGVPVSVIVLLYLLGVMQ
jgi:hypothetical protein